MSYAVIHQISSNTLLGVRERKCAQTWSKLNPDIKCVMWNADDCQKLVASRAAWLFPVYKTLQPSEKVHIVQYLISYLFGGLCVPLYVRCVRPVTRLFYTSKYDVVIFENSPVILSLVKESPFWLSVLELVNTRKSNISLPWQNRVGPECLHKFMTNSVEVLQNPRITILRGPYFSTRRIRKMYGYIYKESDDKLLLGGLVGVSLSLLLIIMVFMLKK